VNYTVSNEATADLENIWLYTFENWSVEQADRYLQLILDEFSYLSKEPNSGKDRSDIRVGYLSSKVKSHVIFYTIEVHSAHIKIERVLHENMDIPNRLRD
jgi:toxin ParE1/3/4